MEYVDRLEVKILIIKTKQRHFNPTPDPSPIGRGDVEHYATLSRTTLPMGEGSGVGLKCRCSLTHIPPVGTYQTTGHKRVFVRQQEGDHGCNLFGTADTSHRLNRVQ